MDLNKSVHHAYIIDGGTFEGRLNKAESIAAFVLCRGETKKPCHACESCIKIEKKYLHPDLIFVRPEDDKKTIGVEVIRNMRRDAYILPNESEKKVYIIEHAEIMQDYAQNALLKILEEPPDHAMFILLCEGRANLIPTVISRCVRESLDFDADSSFTKKEEEIINTMISETVVSLCEKDELKLISALSPILKNYDLIVNFIFEFELLLRDALILSSGGDTIISKYEGQANKLRKTVDADSIASMIRVLANTKLKVESYANKNLTLTTLGYEIMQCVE